LEAGACDELELLLRDRVALMGTQIRSREVLRKAALNLLDRLVNEGSSLAFQRVRRNELGMRSLIAQQRSGKTRQVKYLV
jgi:hypothetical protein